jgi:DNA-binding transcriptional MerR regulator
MFRIGEFARMGQVSVRTLRHYDELGLLQPVAIDRFTGYRYYSTGQLPRLNRILAFKAVGLSLEQIGQLLNADLTSDQLETVLKQKQTDLYHQLTETQRQLDRLESWLSQLGGSKMTTLNNYEITLKRIEPLLVASLRQIMPAYGYLGIPFGTLRSYIESLGASRRHPSLVLWHFSQSDEEDQGYEVEVAEPLDEPLPGNDQIRVYTLPLIEQAASVLHQGSFETAHLAYQALGSWVETQGYKVSGPTRQIHHRFDPRQDPDTFLTEFQIPVTKPNDF